MTNAFETWFTDVARDTEAPITEPTSIRVIEYLGGFARDPRNWTSGMNRIVDLHNTIVGPGGEVDTSITITVRRLGDIRKDLEVLGKGDPYPNSLDEYIQQFATARDDKTLIVVVKP